MNPSTSDEHRVDTLAESPERPPVRPPIDRWGPMYEPSPSWFGAVLAFLCKLNGPTLVAMLAIAGIIYIGAPMARADRELPTSGVVGNSVSVGLLAVISLMALHVEGKHRHAKNRTSSGDKPTDA